MSGSDEPFSPGRPWWRQERRHVPSPASRTNVLVERRHVLPVVHPVVDHFANIPTKIRPPPPEPRPEGVKRVAMPLVTESERPRGIRINANTYVPQSPVQRHKMNSPHKIRLEQQARDYETRLESWMGSKQHREYIDERNQLPQHTNLGDKSYHRVDSSPGFFNLKLHPKFQTQNSDHNNNNNPSSSRGESSRRKLSESPMSYEMKKKVQMRLLEKESVGLLSTSKGATMSWEETTGLRTWTSRTDTRVEVDNK
ncbi:hypothetical protein SDRG_04222 [Saprolegnia diclina VS20]|uniref:Uncharacterized protein n=1 Tax=Saprolegnia diclina (strain VS20) TaxID=1156394 RepID=T0QWY0_SAPDV|nr:hypothetical protein SDRG_04222 [Saprolegnia diclina VS20]EQC38515.1 hypothetical protein SDRG_04222 [Saprolegnia diclina VS20]|eukprot:XP_008608107.1 hypothetical protein SDRG_04222 [Saprolegnia diclina VS20]